MSEEYPTESVPFLITPSMSPVYNNNPGYTVIEIDQSTHAFVQVLVHSLQLQYYITLNQNIWTQEDPLKTYNLDYNNPLSLRNYFNFVQTPRNFGAFLGFEFGFDPFVRNFIIGDILMPLYMMKKDPNFLRMDLCMMLYFDKDDPRLAQCEANP